MKKLTSEEFVLLAMAKQIFVLYAFGKFYAVSMKNSKNVIEIPPEWYIIYKDILEKLKWN